MNTWADLYGEWDARPIPRRPEGAVWCLRCECWVTKGDTYQFVADDETRRFHCNGCDEELFPPEEE